MGHLSTILNGLMRRRRRAKQDCDRNGRDAADKMARDAQKNELVLRSSGTLNVASVFSKRGDKATNQDRCIVWEDFGCQRDMIFCGIFDGHGPWGHFVANQVREAMPSSLLSTWQHTLIAQASSDNKKLHHFNIWKHSYLKTCASIDKELQHNGSIDAFYSGTTALTIVKQGDDIFIANVGDCRAVLGTYSESSCSNLVAEQLTIDMKPNLPQEAARISECNGRVYSLDDEAGVPRLWLPHEESPGLAISRAFGDYCAKDFGLISVPHITHRRITTHDHFIVLATDGVWDVISNEEAVEIVVGTERGKSGKRLVECAARAWKRKRKGIAMDDISAIEKNLNNLQEIVVDSKKI